MNKKIYMSTNMRATSKTCNMPTASIMQHSKEKSFIPPLTQIQIRLFVRDTNCNRVMEYLTPLFGIDKQLTDVVVY